MTMPTVNVTYAPETWESTFPALLACKFARPYARRYYTFRQFLLPDWRTRIPPGYELVRVDQALPARQDLVHLKDVRARTSPWTDYARDGFGFCLLHGATIVAHCLADCVSGSRGIFTHRDYRRRGLGTLTVAATVEYCLERHLPSIGWHCWANYRGSQRLAEKVGFGLAGAYVQYANDAVAENSDDLTPAEWRAQGEFFEHAFEMLGQHASWMAWCAARARGLAGEHAQALTLLQRLLAECGTMPPGRAGSRRVGSLPACSASQGGPHCSPAPKGSVRRKRKQKAADILLAGKGSLSDQSALLKVSLGAVCGHRLGWKAGQRP
jgi:GNAT superfamily N-acetyltransferase